MVATASSTTASESVRGVPPGERLGEHNAVVIAIAEQVILDPIRIGRDISLSISQVI